MRTLLFLLSSCIVSVLGANESESEVYIEGDSCSKLVPTPAYYWASAGGDSRHTGASPHKAPTDLFMGPAWIWENEGRGGTLLRSTPLIDDQKNVYLATAPGEVLKFSPDGQILWKYRARGDLIPDVPTLYDGALLGNTNTGHLFSIDMETGKEIFSVVALGETSVDASSVEVCEGWVLSKSIKPKPLAPGLWAMGGAPRIVALDAKTGDFRWFFVPDAPVNHVKPICVGDSTTVIVDMAGTVYRLNLADGNLVWKVGGTPAVDWAGTSLGGAVLGPDDTIYTASNGMRSGIESGVVRAYRLSDGKFLWWQEMGLPVQTALAVGKVAGVPGDGLSVVIPVGSRPPLPAADRDRSTYPVLVSGVSVLNGSTGEFAKWFPAHPWQGPGAGDRESAVQRITTLGYMHAACGAGSWSKPSISGDGTIYIGYTSGRFYALRSEEHETTVPITDFMGYHAGAAFISAPAIAPDMIAIASCSKLLVFKQ